MKTTLQKLQEITSEQVKKINNITANSYKLDDSKYQIFDDWFANLVYAIETHYEATRNYPVAKVHY